MLLITLLSSLDKYIMENNHNYPIKMATISYSTLKDSVQMLDEEVKENILIVRHEEAEFIITNYMKRIRKYYEIDKSSQKYYSEKLILCNSLCTCYPKLEFKEEYKSREEREEWHIIGLLGQIQITKGQPIAASWFKMKDISDTVEMYFVK